MPTLTLLPYKGDIAPFLIEAGSSRTRAVLRWSMRPANNPIKVYQGLSSSNCSSAVPE